MLNYTIESGVQSDIYIKFNETIIYDNLPEVLEFYLTSERNSHGIVFNEWKDGEELDIKINKDKWIKYNAYIKLKPESHIYSKTKPECIKESTYNCIVSKFLLENFDELALRKKCIPSALTKFIDNELPKCKSPKEDGKALQKIWNKIYNHKCPKPCSILEYSGKLDYWEPKYDNPNNTVIIYLRFQSPEVTTIYEEYLIYDFNAMLGSIGGTLGLFVGFSFSSIIELFINLLKKCKSENFYWSWNRNT